MKDLAVGGGNVSFRLEIMTESPRAAEEIRRDATEKLRVRCRRVNAVTIRLDVQQPGPPPPRGAAGVPPPQREHPARRSASRSRSPRAREASASPPSPRTSPSRSRASGTSVGLMDSDIYGPSQQMMMGIAEKPFINEANQIVPIERYGVKVMSLGFLMDVDQPVIWRGPMVMKAVEQFLQDVALGQARLPRHRPAARARATRS